MTFVSFWRGGITNFVVQFHPLPNKDYKLIVFPLLFIVLILMSNLRFSSMYVYYSIDQEGFIERLCENKDRPELNCDGKCMLSQMLTAQSDEKELPLPAIGWEQVLVFFVEPHMYLVTNLKETDKAYFHYTNNYSYNFIPAAHKPPIV